MNMLSKIAIEDKLYQLERKCVERLGEDKCYKVAFGVVSILTITPIILFALLFIFFPTTALKFAFMVAIMMLFVTATLLGKDLVFYAIRFFRGY